MAEERDVNNRIMILIKELGLTAQKFAEMVEVNSSNIAHISSHRSGPSFTLISSILSVFTDVSPDWLIHGEGEIFRSNNIIDKNLTSSLHELDVQPGTDEMNAATQSVLSHTTEGDINPIDDNNNALNLEQTALPVEKETRRIERIITLYSDGSFEEYFK